MNTHRNAALKDSRAMLDAARIDETLLARAHFQLLSRLELAEGATWQEVLETPIASAWEAAAGSAERFFAHLSDVVSVTPLGTTAGATPVYRLVHDRAGRIDERLGTVLVDIPGSMICASNIDPLEPASPATLPTIYSLSMHEHPTRRDATVMVLAAAALGPYNPWLLPALGHQSSSIRRAIDGVVQTTTRSIPGTVPSRFLGRFAVAGAR